MERGRVADAVLARESLVGELHANYRRLLELAGERERERGEGLKGHVGCRGEGGYSRGGGL